MNHALVALSAGVRAATIPTNSGKEKLLIWRRRPTAQPVLLSAEAAHLASPRTFSIPRRIVRESLRPGDRVKLLFQVDPPKGLVETERMWVEVVKTERDRYVGRLANEPSVLTSLKLGDEISFLPEHVAAREAPPDDPLYTDPSAFAVVSRRVWDGDSWPGRLERREVPDPQFSGWFVLAGDEVQAYKADWDNFQPVPQATICDKFRVLDSGLEGPIGTTMIWNEQAAEYQPERGGGPSS